MGWFLFSENEITVADLKSVLEKSGCPIEIWPDAGVLEICVADKTSIDIEALEPRFRDEEGTAFLAAHNTKALFYIEYPEQAEKKCLPVVKLLKEMGSVLICADSDDFTPAL